MSASVSGRSKMGMNEGQWDRYDAGPGHDTRKENGYRNEALTCNRWRRTGNIANRTTEYNMRANTEMSSGNRDASTTDADMAALIESTDVRLGDEQSKGCVGC